MAYCAVHKRDFDDKEPCPHCKRSERIRAGLKLDGEVHIPEWPVPPKEESK